MSDRARRTRLAVTGGVVLAALVGVGVYVARETESFGLGGMFGGGPCDGRSELVDAGSAPELVPRAVLLPEGSVGEKRAPAVAAAEALGLGPVVAGRFFAGGDAPAIVPLGDDLVWAEAPTTVDGASTLTALSLPQGHSLWERTFTGAAPGGGLVGDLFVTVLGGADPALLSLAPMTGDEAGCVGVPVDAVTTPLHAEQVEADVVTAAGRPVRLARLDPIDGVDWERNLESGETVGSLDAGGTVLLAGRVAHDPVALVQGANQGIGHLPWVTAYDTDDGSPAWTYPPQGDGSAMVAGAEAGSGTAVLVTAEPREPATMGLEAVDARGAPVWARPLPQGYWDASVAAGLVVLRGGGSGGQQQLLLHRPSDGAKVGEVEAPVGDQRRGFGTATEVDGRLLVLSPAGAVWVEPETGLSEEVATPVRIDAVTAVGAWTLVSVDGGILVVGSPTLAAVPPDDGATSRGR